MSGKIVKRNLPPSPRQRCFRPVITPDGELRAGGCTLATVEPGMEGPVLVFRDRYHPRCNKRGTEDVRVWLRDIVEAAERMEGERPLGDPAQDGAEPSCAET